jgi:hypothetical protein
MMPLECGILYGKGSRYKLRDLSRERKQSNLNKPTLRLCVYCVVRSQLCVHNTNRIEAHN